MIRVVTLRGRGESRATYDVVCDGCGSAAPEPGLTPDSSVWPAQVSGWHVATLFPGEPFHDHPVRCPSCRMRAC